jgi:outer membrane receptor protein involved in Fe transport
MTSKSRGQSGRKLQIWTSVLLASSMMTGVGHALAQDAGTNTVEEIIITAQKRAEDLQDVPISVQALGGEKLDTLQVADFGDFVKFLPSVSVQSTAPGFGSVYMRGVASGGDGNHSGPLPSVGIYLDEQPITTIQGALDVHVYDIERVEALAGPQGTLYGASSQAGTIRIITNKPQIGVLKGAVDVEVNQISDGGAGYSAEGFVNVPINDQAALRVVGWYVRDGGYIDNVKGTRTYPTWGGTINNNAIAKKDYNDVDTMGARAALKIDLTEDWTVTPSIMGQTQKSDGNFSYDPNVGDLKLTHFYPEGAKDKWYQAALAVEGKVGNLDVIYAGSFLKRDVNTQSDYSDYSFFYDTLFGYGSYWVDDLNNPINPSQYIQGIDRYKKESHEFRISTPGENPLRLVGGLFYQNQTHGIQQRYKIDGLGSAIEVPGWSDTLWLTKQERSDKDMAVFGEITYDFTEKLSVTGGIRAFKAENGLKGFFGFGAGYSSGTGEAACFGPAVVKGSPCTNLNKTTEEDGYTHRLNVTYKIDDDKMVYGTWSTGYRPGGINRRGTLPPYDSDFLTNYELGWKTSWLQNSLRWNGAVYLERWEDFQFAILGSNGLTEIKNAAQAEIYGVESDVVWRPTDRLTLSGGGAWTNAELSENYCGFVDAKGNPVTKCPAPLAPSGTELPITPKFKANLTARYEFMVGEFDAHVQGSMVTQTSSWTDLRLAERAIIGEQKGWTSFDFSTGLETGAWSMEVYFQNLTDERASLYRYAQCAESVCGGQTYIVPNQPRTIGFRLGREF